MSNFFLIWVKKIENTFLFGLKLMGKSEKIQKLNLINFSILYINLNIIHIKK